MDALAAPAPRRAAPGRPLAAARRSRKHPPPGAGDCRIPLGFSGAANGGDPHSAHRVAAVRRVWPWCVPALALAFVGLPASAQAAGNGDFLDDQPLIVDLSTKPAQVTVTVVNSGAVEADAATSPQESGRVAFTLTVSGPSGTYLTPKPRTKVIRRGVGRFRLAVRASAHASDGTLVLTGSDGTLVRRPVKLVGAVPPQAPLIIGSFESLSLDETSYVPSFLRPLPDALLCGVLAGASLLFTLAAWSAYRKFRASGGGGAFYGGHPRDRVRRSASLS